MTTVTAPPQKHIPAWTKADRLRKAREDAGFTPAQIAELIGISRKTVWNYETGSTRPLRPILSAWAEVTGTYVEWLETGEPPFQDSRLVTSGTGRSLTHDYDTIRALTRTALALAA